MLVRFEGAHEDGERVGEGQSWLTRGSPEGGGTYCASQAVVFIGRVRAMLRSGRALGTLWRGSLRSLPGPLRALSSQAPKEVKTSFSEVRGAARAGLYARSLTRHASWPLAQILDRATNVFFLTELLRGFWLSMEISLKPKVGSPRFLEG
jgi:hypothetical protein